MVSVSPQFNVPMQLAGVNRHHVPGNLIVEIAGLTHASDPMPQAGPFWKK